MATASGHGFTGRNGTFSVSPTGPWEAGLRCFSYTDGTSGMTSSEIAATPSQRRARALGSGAQNKLREVAERAEAAFARRLPMGFRPDEGQGVRRSAEETDVRQDR